MRKPRNDVTADRARSMLDYNPTTGSMTWKVAPAANVVVGDEAGALVSNGRVYISIDGTKYMAHRLAWLIIHGAWPEHNLSAKNGDYTDLRLDNYEELTPVQVSRKGNLRRTNSTGFKGVTWDAKRQRWVATITRDYKTRLLGRFKTAEEARDAYQKAVAESDTEPAVTDIDAIERKRLAAATGLRVKARLLWNKTVRQTNGVLGWSSQDEMIAEVGMPEHSKMMLVPVNPEKTLGPNNWEWRDSRKFDYSTTEGRRAYSQFHREANRNTYRDKELRKNFGIGFTEYEQMLKEQEGVCASCGKAETEMRDGRVRLLAVDHCHTTGDIRGLLCGSCNRGIGKFRDDPVLLRKAADYLERHAAKKSSSASNVVHFKTRSADS